MKVHQHSPSTFTVQVSFSHRVGSPYKAEFPRWRRLLGIKMASTPSSHIHLLRSGSFTVSIGDGAAVHVDRHGQRSVAEPGPTELISAGSLRKAPASNTWRDLPSGSGSSGACDTIDLQNLQPITTPHLIRCTHASRDNRTSPSRGRQPTTQRSASSLHDLRGGVNSPGRHPVAAGCQRSACVPNGPPFTTTRPGKSTATDSAAHAGLYCICTRGRDGCSDARRC